MAFAAVEGGTTLTTQYATTVPVIDGEIDSVWESTAKIHALYGSDNNYATGYAKILWKEDTLYLIAIVSDTTPVVNESNTANQACFWVLETAGNAANYYGSNWNMSINSVGVYGYYTGDNMENRATYAAKINSTNDGYVVELAVPVHKSSSYSKNVEIGFALSIEDDYMAEQISIKEYIYPFTGSKTK